MTLYVVVYQDPESGKIIPAVYNFKAELEVAIRTNWKILFKSEFEVKE